MEIIPVIDLKGGTVVHARMGERHLYLPIETPLARTSDAVDVVEGLLSVYPFTTVYAADLDAIGGAGDNDAALRRLKQAFPQLSLWVDNGVADVAAAAHWLQRGLGHLVLGSETQADTGVVDQFSKDRRAVLSLDFRGDAFQGPPALLEKSDHWPQHVIAMTLHRVGSHAGPDLGRLHEIKVMAGERAVYAAGGVRDGADLRALAKAGIAGALIASSLHNGRVTAADIVQWA
jgi:phosphoribosylformimino-5-aminoimidazole carboxamide ribotide isomerase